MKKVIDLWPIFTLYALFLAYCNQYPYYIEFKINIFNYTTHLELLYSLLPVFTITSSYILFFILQYFFCIALSKKIQNHPEFFGQNKKEKLVGMIITGFILLFFNTILAITIEFIIVDFLNQDSFFFWILVSLQAAILTITTTLAFNNISPGSFTGSILIFLSLMVISVSLYQIRSIEAIQLKNGKMKVETSVLFTYNEIVIASNDTLIFIGQTSTSLFLYNILNKSTTVYKISELQNLIFKPNPTY